MFFDNILTKVFGTANERIIKKMWPVVAAINDLEPATKQLSDEELRAKTVEFKAPYCGPAARELRTKRSLKAQCGEREALDEIAARGLCGGARGGMARGADAAL